MSALINGLGQPEYLHVLLNPLPIYGLAMGVLALVIGLVLKSRPALITALIVVLVSAAAAWPVYVLGENSYEIINATADADGGAWLHEHKARAERIIWAFYALASLSVCALAAPARWPRSGFPLAFATLLCALAVLGAGGWIAYAGGRVRHREFRLEPAPQNQPDTP